MSIRKTDPNPPAQHPPPPNSLTKSTCPLQVVMVEIPPSEGHMLDGAWKRLVLDATVALPSARPN